jgi:hypothetical protein
MLQRVRGLDAGELQELWTNLVDNLLQELFLEVVGGAKVPCHYSFVACGSGARQEMCPYSDIDFVLLIENDSNAGVFRSWCEQVRDKINLFRENEVDSIPKSASMRKGLRFCAGGLNPLGGLEVPELIRSPQSMATLLEDSKLDSHASQGLQETRLMFGSGGTSEPLGNGGSRTIDQSMVLYHLFTKERDHALSRVSWQFSGTPMATLNRRKGLGFVKEALGKAIPLANDVQWDIKQQFYRLPQFIVKGLATYYGVPFASTRKQIETLEGMGHLSAKYAKQLVDVMNAVGKIRVLAHLETGTESDKVYTKPPAPDEKRYPDQKQLTDDEVKSLRAVITVLKELQQVASTWHAEKTKFVINQKRLNPFRDNRDPLRGRVRFICTLPTLYAAKTCPK